MPKPIIKFVADFGPLLLFFIIYFNNENDLKRAIPPFVIATLIALIVLYLLEKKNSRSRFNELYIDYFVWRSHYIF